jgi:hypothetical protein
MKCINIFALTLLITGAATRLQAQLWQGSSISTTTTDNVTIGTSTGATDAKLSIHSGFGVSGCAYTGISGLKMRWQGVSPQPICMNGIAGALPDALHVYDPGYTWNNFTPSTLLRLDGYGRFSLGGDPHSYYGTSIFGRTYFGSDAHVKGKLRIHNGGIPIGDWAANNFPYTFSVDNGDSRFLGKVQVGSTKASSIYSNYALSVDGDIVCRRAVVQTSSWADFVFAPDYALMPLASVKSFINTNHHLPGMPNEAQVIDEGIDIGKMQKMQQQKIEELVLYILQLQAQIELLKQNR